MSEAQRVPIPGSDPKRRGQERWAAPVDPNQTITATVILRRGADTAGIEQDLLSGKYRPSSREDAEQSISATPQDMQAVTNFVEQYGLNVTLANATAHELRVEGTAEKMSDAFGVKIGWFEDANGSRHISYQGSITLPGNLAPLVTAVLGLDQRPIARHANP